MIAALYSARCTFTSEIEAKDNGTGNWLINPKKAKACLSNAASSCMFFMQNKTSWLFLNLMHFWKGDDQAKWLNPTCQVQAMISQGLIMLAGTSFHRVVEGIPGHLLTYTHGPYSTGVRLCSSINKHARNSKMEFPHLMKRREARDERTAICLCFACLSLTLLLAGVLCLSWIRAAELPVMIRAGWWKLEDDIGKQGRRSGEPGEAGGWWEAGDRGFKWLVTSHRPVTRRKASRKDLWNPVNMCPVWGSPSWRRDEGRIDWRWWTVNEGIDFRVRVAGWGLEINWNKDINTSTVLPPEHTHTF